MKLSELRLVEIPAKESASLESVHDGEVLVGFTSESVSSEILAHKTPPFFSSAVPHKRTQNRCIITSYF
jgi:hypothetical protein